MSHDCLNHCGYDTQHRVVPLASGVDLDTIKMPGMYSAVNGIFGSLVNKPTAPDSDVPIKGGILEVTKTYPNILGSIVQKWTPSGQNHLLNSIRLYDDMSTSPTYKTWTRWFDNCSSSIDENSRKKLNYAKSYSCPIKDLQKTIDNIPKHLYSDVEIKVTSGTITEDILIQGFEGPYKLTINCVDGSGNPLIPMNPQTHKCNSIAILNNICVEVRIVGFVATGQGWAGFYTSGNTCRVVIQTCDTTSGTASMSGNDAFYSERDSGIIELMRCTFSNKFYAVKCVASNVIARDVAGTGNTIGYSVDSGGTISIVVATLLTATTLLANSGGLITGPGYSGATTTEQLTGRIYNGKPTYNRQFTNVITQTANTITTTMLITLPLNHTYRLVDYHIQWSWGGATSGFMTDVYGFGNATATNPGGYSAGIINRVDHATSGFALVSLSTGARTNAPFDVWLEYTKD